MFGIPATTAYDLRFRALGIPVRVHPLFWLIAALIAGVGGQREVWEVLALMGCIFLSILVHEMGHGLSARLFGAEPAILLYGMGGLCYYENDRQRPWQRLVVLFSGPGAGFVLAGLAFLVRPETTPGSAGWLVVQFLVFINIFWGLINLLPIWPLDGGQITSVFLTLFSRANGRRWAHVISLLTAGLLAFVVFRYTQELFLTLFFAFFALTNFQVLQAMHTQSRYGYAAHEDEADWWRR